MSELTVTFPGGKRVVAHVEGHAIESDQPVHLGGENRAAAPFDLFLAALANCAGYFVLAFCLKRDLPTEGLEIHQEAIRDPETHRVTAIRQELTLPDGFPEKYRKAVLRAAASCSIKKLLQDPPVVEQLPVERVH